MEKKELLSKEQENELIRSVVSVGRFLFESLLDDTPIEVESFEYDSQRFLYTSVEVEAEKRLCQTIRAVCPSLPVITSCEAALAYPKLPDRKACFFMVDGLDGTESYISHLGDYTVNLALIMEGRPIFGVISAPHYGGIYYTRSTGGAFRRGRFGLWEEPLISKPLDPPRALVSLRDSRQADWDLLRQIGIKDIRPIGSSYKFCLLAEGFASIVLRTAPCWGWSVAAAETVVRHSGGIVLSLGGAPLEYRPDSFFRLKGHAAVNSLKTLWPDAFLDFFLQTEAPARSLGTRGDLRAEKIKSPVILSTAPAQEKASLEIAAALLRVGELVAVPTETVYGLAADATNDAAVERIYILKKRPRHNPLIVHVSDFAMAEAFGFFSPLAVKLAGEFWPGPLTLIVEQRPDSGLSSHINNGERTVGIRCPELSLTRRLIKLCGRPVAAPSANISGRLSTTDAEGVHRQFSRHSLAILDGGPASLGVESTVIDVRTDRVALLRAGALSVESLEAFLGFPLLYKDDQTHRQKDDTLLAPGSLLRHYAPRLPLRLKATVLREGEGGIGFGAETFNHQAHLNLSPSGDLQEAGYNLFRYLDQLDDPTRFSGLAVVPLPPEGLGRALNDRLRRAEASQQEDPEQKEPSGTPWDGNT